MKFDSADYNIVIQKSNVDGETLFSARVKELPDVEVFEASAEAAYASALEAITALAGLAEEMGHQFPAPIKATDDEYSGRVTLRMPKSLHKKIAEVADVEAVSLNHYIVSVLASAAATSATYFSNEQPVLANVPAMGMTVSGLGLNAWNILDSSFVTCSTPVHINYVHRAKYLARKSDHWQLAGTINPSEEEGMEMVKRLPSKVIAGALVKG